MAEIPVTVQEFAEIARNYCDFIEHDSDSDPKAFIRKALDLVLLLMLHALKLPDLEGASFQKTEIDIDACDAIRNRIRARVPQDEYYWEVFDPLQNEKPDPLKGGLVDDLADIWLEVKAGLLILESKSRKRLPNAVYKWRFGFDVHWGVHHAVTAIRVLNAVRIKLEKPA
jgi:hypothetical protein